MSATRHVKDMLYDQVAHLWKAVSSAKRLEWIAMPNHGEKSVGQLAAAAGIDVNIASAQLQPLKSASLVAIQRDGKNVWYRPVDPKIVRLWLMLRQFMEGRIAARQRAIGTLVSPPRSRVRRPESTDISNAQLSSAQ